MELLDAVVSLFHFSIVHVNMLTLRINTIIARI